MSDSKKHWEGVYSSKPSTEVSWYKPHLDRSLELISRSGVSASSAIIDIGGGASTLADDLLERNFNVTVLDISEAALETSKKRLGPKAGRVTGKNISKPARLR